MSAGRSTSSSPDAAPDAATGPWPFCAAVRDRLVPLAPPWCARCGCPSPFPVPSCRDCPPSPVASARAPFLYEGPARRAVHRLKFAGWRDVAGALARCDRSMRRAAGRRRRDLGPPGSATPAPNAATTRRGRWRSALGRRLDRAGGAAARPAPVATGPQARRGGDERRDAMHGAFAVRRPRRAGAGAARRRRPHHGRHGGGLRRGPRRGGGPPRRRRDGGPRDAPRPRVARHARCCLSSTWALVRVCGCPGMFPGSRCQPRAKRPT